VPRQFFEHNDQAWELVNDEDEVRVTEFPVTALLSVPDHRDGYGWRHHFMALEGTNVLREWEYNVHGGGTVDHAVEVEVADEPTLVRLLKVLEVLDEEPEEL
jgi:hypothetical protein